MGNPNHKPYSWALTQFEVCGLGNPKTQTSNSGHGPNLRFVNWKIPKHKPQILDMDPI